MAAKNALTMSSTSAPNPVWISKREGCSQNGIEPAWRDVRQDQRDIGVEGMSEITRGVIGMPFDLAMGSELSRRQFHSIARGLLAENDRLRTAEGDAITYKAGMENVAQQRDQLKVENEKFDEGVRSMACSLGAGGYNAEILTADQLVDKVQWGLTNLADSSVRLLDQVRAERDQLFGQTEQLKAENEALRRRAEFWRSPGDMPESGAEVVALRDAGSVGNGLHPGSRTGRWLELTTTFGSMFACDAISTGRVIGWAPAEEFLGFGPLCTDAARYRWLRTQNIPLNGHDFLSSHEILDRRVDAATRRSSRVLTNDLRPERRAGGHRRANSHRLRADAGLELWQCLGGQSASRRDQVRATPTRLHEWAGGYDHPGGRKAQGNGREERRQSVSTRRTVSTILTMRPVITVSFWKCTRR